MKAWAIKAPTDELVAISLYSELDAWAKIAIQKEPAQDAKSNFERDGYRAVQVEVREVEQTAAGQVESQDSSPAQEPEEKDGKCSGPAPAAATQWLADEFESLLPMVMVSLPGWYYREIDDTYVKEHTE